VAESCAETGAIVAIKNKNRRAEKTAVRVENIEVALQALSRKDDRRALTGRVAG